MLAVKYETQAEIHSVLRLETEGIKTAAGIAISVLLGHRFLFSSQGRLLYIEFQLYSHDWSPMTKPITHLSLVKASARPRLMANRQGRE